MYRHQEKGFTADGGGICRIFKASGAPAVRFTPGRARRHVAYRTKIELQIMRHALGRAEPGFTSRTGRDGTSSQAARAGLCKIQSRYASGDSVSMAMESS